MTSRPRSLRPVDAAPSAVPDRAPAHRAGTLATTLWGALVLAGCGTPGASPGPTPGPVDYSWALPADDATAAGVDGEIYQALRRGCDDGETTLAQRWQASSGPREVLMFQAGVLACRADVPGARALYDRAREEFGWAGLGPAQASARCDLYKSVASVVENAPRDRFPCPDGTAPTFRTGANGTMDNPLTPVDESATSAVIPATGSPIRAAADPVKGAPVGTGVVRGVGGEVAGDEVTRGVRQPGGAGVTATSRVRTTRGATPPATHRSGGPPPAVAGQPPAPVEPPPVEPPPVEPPPVVGPSPNDGDPAPTDPQKNMDPAAPSSNNMDPAATPAKNMNPDGSTS